MLKCLVIGAGRMATGIIFDLLNQKDIAKIHVLDSSKPALIKMEKLFGHKRIQYHEADVDDRQQVVSLMRDVKGVIRTIPYEKNFLLTQWAIDAHCHFVDLGGNNTVVNKQFSLNVKAKRVGVMIIPDCGLAPGMASVLATNAVEKLLQNSLTYDSDDVTLILLKICGHIEGVAKQLEYRTIQYGDVQNNLMAMMRTKAFPAAITLKMLLENRNSNRSVLCQESSILSQIYMHELEKRGIRFDILNTMEKE